MSKTVAEIIDLYIKFFKSKGHTAVPSSSLYPQGDPSLLFTTAGMVQFKPLFTGAVELPYTRAASVQKCLRTTDLENVGKTERHCTFFEMLGNFSFGDYFKKEAIEFAWDFSANHLGFPKEKIWTTVYLDDDEAVGYWKEQGVPAERIVRLGKKDNFWGPAGDSGACGPSTELYLDRGIDKGCKRPECAPGCDCDRFMEFWNLVFNQYNQDTEGNLHPLKQTGIDTGAGVERIAVLLQNVDSVYDTDELKRIIAFVEKLSGVKYAKDNAPSFRVIADHSRAVMFALADGISPDRTGRGYVIRRLIRRASLFARKIGLTESFLYKLVDELAAIYKTRYPELVANIDQIKNTIKAEEELFIHTLENGLSYLDEILAEYRNKNIKEFSGKDAFKLYGTYGFPVEMTIELAEEQGLAFDQKGFAMELEKDRVLSRESWTGNKVSYVTNLDAGMKTAFTGYTDSETKSNVLLIFSGDRPADVLSGNQEGVIVTSATPFYAESGGQLGDTGLITAADGVFAVTDTRKENDVFLHIGKMKSGTLKKNDQVTLTVDSDRRQLLAGHHSGTHLLNGALRKTLGTHVMQKASLVAPDYLRFDFSHTVQMKPEEITGVEALVNRSIQSAIPVVTREMAIDEAKKTGAVAAFDEKYGNMVRVVAMGEASVEFCGGIHVKNTADIGYFTIVKESSPGAGNRRIEAVCGPKVGEYFHNEFEKLRAEIAEFNEKTGSIAEAADLIIKDSVPGQKEISQILEAERGNAIVHLKQHREKLEASLAANNLKLHKLKKKLEQSGIAENTELAKELFDKAELTGEIKLITSIFTNQNLESLKDLGDKLKSRGENIVVLFANLADKVTFVFMCSKALADSGRIHCGDLVKNACAATGGKGGGRADFAQGGGSDLSQAETAMAEAVKSIHKKAGV